MKKSLIIRMIIIAAVIIGWTASMFPIREQDFLKKFESLSDKTVRKLNKSLDALTATSSLDDAKAKLDAMEDKSSKEYKALQEQYADAIKAKTYNDLQTRIASVQAESPTLSPFRVLERAAQGDVVVHVHLGMDGEHEDASLAVCPRQRRRLAGL